MNRSAEAYLPSGAVSDATVSAPIQAEGRNNGPRRGILQRAYRKAAPYAAAALTSVSVLTGCGGEQSGPPAEFVGVPAQGPLEAQFANRTATLDPVCSSAEIGDVPVGKRDNRGLRCKGSVTLTAADGNVLRFNIVKGKPGEPMPGSAEGLRTFPGSGLGAELIGATSTFVSVADLFGGDLQWRDAEGNVVILDPTTSISKPALSFTSALDAAAAAPQDGITATENVTNTVAADAAEPAAEAVAETPQAEPSTVENENATSCIGPDGQSHPLNTPFITAEGVTLTCLTVQDAPEGGSASIYVDDAGRQYVVVANPAGAVLSQGYGAFNSSTGEIEP